MNVGELENYEDAKNTFQNALKTIDRALAVNPSYPLAIQKREELMSKMREEVKKYIKIRNQLQ